MEYRDDYTSRVDEQRQDVKPRGVQLLLGQRCHLHCTDPGRVLPRAAPTFAIRLENRQPLGRPAGGGQGHTVWQMPRN